MTAFLTATLLALLSIGAIVQGEVPTCPPPSSEPPSEALLYPNSANCSQYYECDNGVAHLLDCPEGLHFNAKDKVCDHPWAANCVESHKRKEVIHVVVAPQADLPTCPLPGDPNATLTLFPNPENCTTYYECDNGQLLLVDCPLGTHFNPIELVCDHPWAANCEESRNTKKVVHARVETHADVPTCPPPSSEPPSEALLYPNSANCSQYYECDNGVAQLLECPAGLHFNAKDKVCDHPWAANCVESHKRKKVVHARVETHADVPTCPPPSSEPPGEALLYPNSANCSQYYECDNGVAHLLDCPAGLHFNAKDKVCDHPWAANCVESHKRKKVVHARVETHADVPTCPPPSSEPPSEALLYPNSANCSQYYECDNGVAQLLECPAGLHFNAKDKVCDHPWAANCVESHKRKKVVHARVETHADVPTCPPPSSEPPGEALLYPNSANCSQYYECDNGVAHLLDCPAGLHFNAKDKVCDHPWAANCVESHKRKKVVHAKVETHADVPTCPPPSSEPPSEALLYPNSANCSQYYECDNGVAQLLECPAGLHFNAKDKVCDHPWAANCVESHKRKKVVHARVETHADVPTCPPPSSEPPGEALLYPNSANCSQYYECDNGVAHLLDCPEGLHFNAKDKVCDHPWAANCEVSLRNYFEKLLKMRIMKALKKTN